ncbi:hypothetical protein SUDANB58_05127 [Streptomyces sp. enrichment culture]|uniref:hypothetical protein n=1 Tax=Streptomyces sp. enrichment culture TaxID=1795815 RepID=UPI003F57DA5C
MTTGTVAPALPIDEFAARAVPRCARSASTEPRARCRLRGPVRAPGGAVGREHPAGLALIEEFRRRGMTVAAIGRRLRGLPPGLTARDPAPHGAVVASRAPDTVGTAAPRAPREELRERLGGDTGVEAARRGSGVPGLRGLRSHRGPEAPGSWEARRPQRPSVKTSPFSAFSTSSAGGVNRSP